MLLPLLLLQVVERFTAHYVFALGLSRFLSCAHWVLQVGAWRVVVVQVYCNVWFGKVHARTVCCKEMHGHGLCSVSRGNHVHCVALCGSAHAVAYPERTDYYGTPLADPWPQLLEGNKYLLQALGSGLWPVMVLGSEVVQTFILGGFW
jgi:hypothetical protein